MILYILFATLNYLLTWNKFENYLVSELFSQSAVGDEGSKENHVMQRDTIPKEFYNEIIHDDDQVLTQRGCCGRQSKLFRRGRELTA